MIVKLLCLFLGIFLGMLVTSLAVIAGDADRCAECQRRRDGK